MVVGVVATRDRAAKLMRMPVPDAQPPGHDPRRPRSRPAWRRVIVVASFLPATLVLGALARELVWIPNQQFGDADFLAHASVAEQVKAAERVLAFPVGNHHDACLLLDAAGDVRAVPALLRGLRWVPEPVDGAVVCTTIHCLDALRRITGHDAGATRKEWSTWWKTTGAALPASAFPAAPIFPRPPPAVPPRVRSDAPPSRRGAGW